MHANLNLILILLIAIQTIFAALNGNCNGRNGICINADTCSQFGGQTFSGKCPNDPNDVKCCDNIPCSANDGRKGNCLFSSQCNGDKISGKCPGGNDFICCVGSPNADNTYNGPCTGGGGACINVDNTDCDTQTVAGKCPGSNNVKCCVAGKRYLWYVNQNEHTDVLFKIPGSNPVDKTVSCCGCGISCLSMAINVLTNNYVSPENLFVEGYKSGNYWGEGFSHEGLSYLGKKHGVRISWTDNMDTVFNALQSGKPVIFNVGPENKYRFTTQGHYIFLYGAKIQNNVQKVYVFDPNGRNNYINVLFPLRRSVGGIEVAKRGNGDDFGIVDKA